MGMLTFRGWGFRLCFDDSRNAPNAAVIRTLADDEAGFLQILNGIADFPFTRIQFDSKELT